jgi:hypothetical protein
MCAVQNSTLPDLDVGTDLSTLWLQEDLTDVLEGGVCGALAHACIPDSTCMHAGFRELEVNEGSFRGVAASNSKRILVHERWTTAEVRLFLSRCGGE